MGILTRSLVSCPYLSLSSTLIKLLVYLIEKSFSMVANSYWTFQCLQMANNLVTMVTFNSWKFLWDVEIV